MELTCSSICERRREAPYRKMIWRLTEVGNMGETLQSSKDCLPILVMLLPIVADVRPEQSVNACITANTRIICGRGEA